MALPCRILSGTIIVWFTIEERAESTMLAMDELAVGTINFVLASWNPLRYQFRRWIRPLVYFLLGRLRICP